ncbi:uncharacterized protein L969DRAFT_96864 [Mixia osmundae IAM 14324]|uniref:Uncharacterized protein n=1 Tax=Mixia osmundae (strain CBS 9802 / IAM 14324 / JCM 22182 / KY 12970) TaxID=764103 RepID=G7E2B3_MIXOS|nr:uncharacterized protein L969DRAFT_96864 [Mixia osmundae IAM 14324]KEI36846.1 hypothetical protein L969DRAFT_96864 [Mixia osmundae IAM 14324]GAA96973.1 hypothetical protein E5Q_03647 [Mixia osmundae IAM 14324]
MLKLFLLSTLLGLSAAAPSPRQQVTDLTASMLLTSPVLKPTINMRHTAGVRVTVSETHVVSLVTAPQGVWLFEDGPIEYLHDKAYMDYVLSANVDPSTSSQAAALSLSPANETYRHADWLSKDVQNCCKITVFYWLHFVYSAQNVAISLDNAKTEVAYVCNDAGLPSTPFPLCTARLPNGLSTVGKGTVTDPEVRSRRVGTV